MKKAQSLFQSLSKRDGDFIAQNEDAVRVDLPKRLALSDGAGGTGVEAHQWARHLLDNLPDAPMRSFDDVTAWQDGIWQPYFDKIEGELTNSRSNALDKFYTEGSSATLVAAWFEGKGKTRKAHILSYGDSVILLWREKTRKIWTNTPDLSVFLDNPFLLNCNEPPVAHGYFDTWSVQKGDVLILASDTIGQFLLSSFYLLHAPEKHATMFDAIRKSPVRFAAIFQDVAEYYQQHSDETWAKVLAQLTENLATADKFRVYTEGLKSFGLLGFDDYSVILHHF